MIAAQHEQRKPPGKANISTRASSMTADDLRRCAQAWAERTATEQGLPLKIDNPIILRTVAEILWPDGKKPSQA